MAEAVGAVGVLRRYPVKSMQGEELRSAVIGEHGVLGDRAFGVVERDSGQVIRGKTPELGPRLLACRATFVAAPQPGRGLPPVEIELPDGSRVCSDAPRADDALTSYFGVAVRLVPSAPPYSAFVTGRGEFLADVGLQEQIGETSLLDAMPVSVVTTSTLDRLATARPETRFDDRRFRMNVVVATRTEGFLENAWPGRDLQLGDVARLRVAIPVPRCSVTTMAQEELPRDLAVLRTVARENSIDVAGRAYACVGVYASVDAVGEIRTDDPVWLV